MATKPTTKEIEVDDAMVVAAATDINTVLKPNPLLDLEKAGEELQKDVEELFDNIMKEDALSKETWVTLIALGWKTANAPKIEKPKAILVKTPQKASKEVQAHQNPAPTKAVKASTMSHKASKADKASLPPKAAKPAKKGTKTVGRMGAVGLVLAVGAVKKNTIATQADKLYVKSGGKSNIKTATMFYYFARQLLQAMGMWKEENGVVTIK